MPIHPLLQPLHDAAVEAATTAAATDAAGKAAAAKSEAITTLTPQITAAHANAVTDAAVLIATAKNEALTAAAADAASKDSAIAATTKTAAVAEVNNTRVLDRMPAHPRLRATVTATSAAPLLITDQWQTITFVKTGAFDIDNYPTPRLNAAGNTLIADPADTYDKFYDFEVYFELACPGLLPINTLQYRFFIPTANITFPFPDGGLGGYLDIAQLYKTPQRVKYDQTIFYNAPIRQYGVQVQIRTSSLLSGVNQPRLIGGGLALFPR